MLASTLLVILITFEGAMNGQIESIYCRFQSYALPMEDEDEEAEIDVEYGSAAAFRRLVAAKGVSTAPDFSMSFAYRDAETCPPRALGPVTIFDVLDMYCLTLNQLIWLLIQVWALWRYMRESGAFSQRIAEISTRRKKAISKIKTADVDAKLLRTPSKRSKALV